jgi:hypothetical protein
LAPAEIVLESAMRLSLPPEDFLNWAQSCHKKTVISNGGRVTARRGSILGGRDGPLLEKPNLVSGKIENSLSPFGFGRA